MDKIKGLIVISIIVMSLCACGKKESKVSTSEIVTTDGGKLQVDINDGVATYNGTERLTYTVNDGEKCSFEFRTEKINGNIGFEVINVNKSCTYEACEAAGSSEVVTFEEAGNYEIWITAKDYEGEYSYSWACDGSGVE